MELTQAVVRTLAYFDLFDYPLTLFEVWKFLWRPAGIATTLADIGAVTETLQREGRIDLADGYYCLPGRQIIIVTRAERYRLSMTKMKIAEREAKRLSLIPGVVGVAVNNSLAYRNSRPGGDIDFFVITRLNAVWQSRGLAALYAAIFDKRPRLAYKKNKLCLCFFVTEPALNLSSYLLPINQDIPDIDFVYRVGMMRPVVGTEAVWQTFHRANSWLTRYMPNMQFRFFGSVASAPVEPVSVTEHFLYKVQTSLLPGNVRSMLNTTSEAVANSMVVKLHQNNDREEIRRRFIIACGGN